MARTIQFLPAARFEAMEAYDWYLARSPRAAEGFVAELDYQLGRVANSAETFPLMLADVRRVRLRRYPYGVFFRIMDESCFVIACFHGSRDPRVWQERV